MEMMQKEELALKYITLLTFNENFHKLFLLQNRIMNNDTSHMHIFS